MAAGGMRNLLLAFCACFCTSVCWANTLYITHSPNYVEFHKDAGHIDVTDVPDVLTLALGLSSSKDLSWQGLDVGDLFHRPKANVLVTIETVDNLFSLDGSYEMKYPLHINGEMDVQTLRDAITSVYGDRALFLEITPDVKGLQVSAEYQDVFEKVPDTLSGMLPLLKGDKSVVTDNELGSLNMTNPADVALLSELQLLREVVQQLRANPSGVKDNTPDVYSFSLSGLRLVQTSHGATSSQAKDAARLLASFISQFSSDMTALYGGDVLVEVMTSHQEPLVSRHGRSLLQAGSTSKPTPTPASGVPSIKNKAVSYDENYPVVFNIILWMVIILALAVYAVAYGLWNLDPGDTIIYRMTSQRIKSD